MKGETTIILNQRTVEAAIQAYLDQHFTPPMRLTKLVPAAMNYETWTYTATMEEIVIEPPP